MRLLLVVAVIATGFGAAALVDPAGGRPDAAGSFSVSIDAPSRVQPVHKASAYVGSTVTGSGRFTIGALRGAPGTKYGPVSGVSGEITVSHRYANAADNWTYTITLDPTGQYSLFSQGFSVLTLRGKASGGCLSSGPVVITTNPATGAQRLYVPECGGDQWLTGAGVETTIRTGTTPKLFTFKWIAKATEAGFALSPQHGGSVLALLTLKGSGTETMDGAGRITKAAGGARVEINAPGTELDEVWILKVTGGRYHEDPTPTAVLTVTVDALNQECAPKGTLEVQNGRGKHADRVVLRVCGLTDAIVERGSGKTQHAAVVISEPE